MIIGFTGTRKGLSASQKKALGKLLKSVHRAVKIKEVHHGMCVGADADFHKLVREICPGVHIVGHPSNIEEARAELDVDELREPKPPLDRNRDVVDEAHWLWAAPRRSKEVLRSGTWMTVRYANKVGRKVSYAMPGDGGAR